MFQDKCIPRPFTFKPWLNRSLNWDAHVSNLLTPSGGWDLGLLDQFFCVEDMDAIASIALGLLAHLEDSEIWFFPKNGKYSIKTEYQVAL